MSGYVGMDVDDDDGRRTDLAGNGEHIIVGDERLQATITVLSITPLVGHVLSFLGYQGLARVACVAKRFRTLRRGGGAGRGPP